MIQIKEFYIDGFGLINDYSADELSPPLNLFYGANETGKSTIKDFILSTLFGFKQKSDLGYRQPLNGGNSGGRLTITENSLQSIIIERNARRSNLILRGNDHNELDVASIQ